MPLSVEVVSPEQNLFTGEAEFVLARTVEGEIGILPGHTPILAQLAPSTVKIRPVSGAEETFEIPGGFMTVKEDKVIILAEEVAEEVAEETGTEEGDR